MPLETPQNTPRPTLSKALESAFEQDQAPADFAVSVTNLALTLTGATAAGVLANGTVLAMAPMGVSLPPAATALAKTLETRDGGPADPEEKEGSIAVSLCLPDGNPSTLVVVMQGQGAASRALAYERVVGLSHASYAHYRHPIFRSLHQIATSSGVSPTETANEIRAFLDADLVVFGWRTGQGIDAAFASGQSTESPRSGIVDLLSDTSFDGSFDQVIDVSFGQKTFVLKVQSPRRLQDLIPLLAHAAASAHPPSGIQKQRRLGRLIKLGSAAVLLAGLLLLPLPDAKRISAEIRATEARQITAPFTGVIASVDVDEGQDVTASKTVLARLNDSEILQELLSIEAEYSRALLDRESARLSRDAAGLRTAELEVERLSARVSLLKTRRESALLLAPIDGQVVGMDLAELTGTTVRQGDPLMRVVDPSGLVLALEVPDELVLDINATPEGIFRPDFDPRRQSAASLDRISPAMSNRSDRAVFDARATFQGDTIGLRPGMRGVFIFDRGYRPLWHIIWQGARDWVLLRVWI